MASSSIVTRWLTLVACAVFACLAGCGGTAQHDLVAKTTITLWHNWQGADLAAKQQLIAAYMQGHPHVSVVLVQKADLANQAPAAIKSGVGPDVVAGPDNELGALVNAGVLQPADQWISPAFLQATYLPAAAAGLTFQGHAWGVPVSLEGVTLLYNKRLVSTSQLPITTDDLLTFNASYAADHPGHYGVVWDPTNGYYNAAFVYGFGGFYVQPDGTVGLDSAGTVQAGQFIADLRATLPAHLSQGVAGQLFGQGLAAAIIDGPWAYQDYATTAKIDVGFARLPLTSGHAATPFVNVESLWISRTSGAPAIAADLLKFLTTSSSAVTLAQRAQLVPANTQANQQSVVTNSAMLSGFVAQYATSVALPNTPYMDAIWTHVDAAWSAIWQGTATPTAALEQAQTAAQRDVAALGKTS